MARLDVETWTLHYEPPAAVDAAVDRRARNHLAWSEMSSYAVIAVLVLSLLPPVRELALIVLVLMVVLVMPPVLVSVFRHRTLRRITGAPVISEITPMIEPAAQMLAADRAVFHEALALRPEDTDAATLAEARQVGTDGLKDQRKIARHLLRYFELAALYERWGWMWARNRYINKLSNLILALARPRTTPTDADST